MAFVARRFVVFTTQLVILSSSPSVRRWRFGKRIEKREKTKRSEIVYVSFGVVYARGSVA